MLSLELRIWSWKVPNHSIGGEIWSNLHFTHPINSGSGVIRKLLVRVGRHERLVKLANPPRKLREGFVSFTTQYFVCGIYVIILLFADLLLQLSEFLVADGVVVDAEVGDVGLR